MSEQFAPPNPSDIVVENAPPAPEEFQTIQAAGDAAISALVDVQSSREPLIPKEKLRDFVMSSGFGIHAYVDKSRLSQGIVQRNRGNTCGFDTLMTHENMVGGIGEHNLPKISDELLEKFLANGVTELVRSTYIGKPVSELLGDSSMSNEEAVKIEYRTLAGTKPEEPHAMSQEAQNTYDAYSRARTKGAKAADPQFEAALLMPKSMAEEFLAAAEQDPQLFREVMETAIVDRLGDENLWNGERGIRPAYEWWHEYNQGIDKIAVRFATPEDPKPPIETLEFSAVY